MERHPRMAHKKGKQMKVLLKDAKKLVTKLELKRGNKYLMFIPVSTGMYHNEVVELNEVLEDQGYNTVMVLVDDTEGIKFVEIENEKETKS